MAAQVKEKVKSMHWHNEHDVMLVRQVLLYEPWKYRQGSVERGQIWKAIAESLNSLENLNFRVSDRSTRDRLNLLLKKFNSKENRERQASGIDVEDESEVDQGLRDIQEQLEDSETIRNEESKAKKRKLEEASQAEELRLSSLETYGQSKARKGESNDPSDEPTKKRRSSNDTIGFLQAKSKEENELRKQENELRKQEIELKKKEMENMQSLLLNQQKQTNDLIQQQQQMNLIFLQTLNRFLPEKPQ